VLVDAGAPVDAGVDAGAAPDGGGSADAGSDAGAVVDAGGDDAGVLVDAGGFVDAGTCAPYVFVIDPDVLVVREDGTAIDVTVTIEPVPLNPVSVAVTTSTGAEVALDRGLVTTGTSSSGGTFSIAGRQDQIVDLDAGFTVHLALATPTGDPCLDAIPPMDAQGTNAGAEGVLFTSDDTTSGGVAVTGAAVLGTVDGLCAEAAFVRDLPTGARAVLGVPGFRTLDVDWVLAPNTAWFRSDSTYLATSDAVGRLSSDPNDWNGPLGAANAFYWTALDPTFDVVPAQTCGGFTQSDGGTAYVGAVNGAGQSGYSLGMAPCSNSYRVLCASELR
jgi:hypothetical protein